MKMLASFSSLALGDLLDWGKEELKVLGSSEAEVNAEQLLCQTAGLDRFQLYLEPRRKISRELKIKYCELIARRKKRIPLAYLVGEASFWNETLKVNQDCLIPRPETELLVEQFIRQTRFQKDQAFSFLDLGAGSGAIGISLLRHFAKAKATFSDISRKALELVRDNLTCYALLNRAEIIYSDLFSSFTAEDAPGLPGVSGAVPARGDRLGAGGRAKRGPLTPHPTLSPQGERERVRGFRKWNTIVSNPPYLSEDDWQAVEPEIFFEPKIALQGGKDGLDFYRRIVPAAKSYLETNGWLFLETGKGQAGAVRNLFEQNHFQNIMIFKDFNRIERIVSGQV